MALTKKQAKTGLWVRDPNGNISQLRKGGLGLTSKTYYAFEDCSLWEPMEREWCWFWNAGDKTPTLGKFSHMFGRCFAMNDHLGFDTFMYCEPYIGVLPTLLKEDADG